MQKNIWSKKIHRDKGSLMVRPFENLRQLLSEARRRPPSRGEGSPASSTYSNTLKEKPSSADSVDEHQDTKLFLSATRDVKPLESNKIRNILDSYRKKTAVIYDDEQALILKRLKDLVDGKNPVIVHHTSEYVEWTRATYNPQLAAKLHRGGFAVQAYCELHGMDSIRALDTCENFISRVLLENKRCIAFIHGRGLSSPRGPVLKEVVVKWLTRGPYRRFVMAFSSAPIWDGGTGVTYVLLRRRPARRMRKKYERRSP